MDIYEESVKLHRELKGKIELRSKMQIRSMSDLSLIYTPGVAGPCKEIAEDPSKVYDFTAKENTIAIVSDGTRVLGLGNLGELASIPVLEGKSIIFKLLGNINAIPICLKAKDANEIINTIIAISPNFSGINLEDIEKPKCFIIERELQERLDIPVFHDDQHGTAVVTLAGVFNSLKIVGKKISGIKAVVVGAGAAGIAVTRYLYRAGCRNIILTDSRGIINRSRSDLDSSKKEMLNITNPENLQGTFEDAVKDADLLIGLSTIPNLIKPAHIRSMSKDPIVFALSNPFPEIMPDEAKKAGAKIIATGRSDFPNQINNSLVFPGIFRGALDVRAKVINVQMKIAAAKALASLVDDKDLSPDHILPTMIDSRISAKIAVEVAREAMENGVARIKRDLKEIEINAGKISLSR